MSAWDQLLRALGFNRPKLQGRHLPGPTDNAGTDLHTFYYAWDASLDPSTTGYRLYVGRTAGGPYNYTGSPKDMGNALDGSFGVRDAGTFYAIVKAYNAANQESAASSEIAQTWAPSA